MTPATIRKLVAAVVAVFAAAALWTDPAGAAGAFHGIVGSVGGFFSSVIDKGATFVKHVVN